MDNDADPSGRSPAGTVCSNTAEGTDVSVLRTVVLSGRERSVRRADHSSRGVLPNVVRIGVRSRNLKNAEATVRVGPQRHRKMMMIMNGRRKWRTSLSKHSMQFLTTMSTNTINVRVCKGHRIPRATPRVFNCLSFTAKARIFLPRQSM